jgi:AAA domain
MNSLSDPDTLESYEPFPLLERLRPMDIHALLALDIPERQMILDPVIPEKGLAMLYAGRGTGKTFVACGMSHAAATGTKFLKWQAPKARKLEPNPRVVVAATP